jgi:hypothetical protein
MPTDTVEDGVAEKEKPGAAEADIGVSLLAAFLERPQSGQIGA